MSLTGMALQFEPGYPPAQIIQARAALVARDHESASGLAMGLLDDPGMRPAALEILGRVALQQQQWTQALAHFEALAVALPQSALGPYWLGVARFREGNPAAAQDHLMLAHRRNPSPRIASALVDVLISTEQWDSAAQLAGGYTKADSALERGLGHAWLGGVQRAKGDLEGAAKSYRAAVQEQPDRIAYTLAAADLLIDLQRFEQASALLDQASMKAPQHRLLQFKRAYLAQLAGNAAAAEQGYRSVLQRDPDWALPLLNLSEVVAADAGRSLESMELAERAARLAPRWMAAHWNLAQRAHEAENGEMARAAAMRVIELDPQHAGARAMLEAGNGNAG